VDRDPVVVLPQADQLGPEPDLAAMIEDVLGEDRLQSVSGNTAILEGLCRRTSSGLGRPTDTSVPGTDRLGWLAMVSRTSWDCRRIVSSSPQLRMISIGRGRIPVALGKTGRPGASR
jgi:hypothetical protein